jgi:DNA modification methylase
MTTKQVGIRLGDCIAVMKSMADNSVDSIVTDPPYELTNGSAAGGGFMGKKWDATGIAHSVEMWSEALRVLKPGGHLLAFSGSRTYHRMTCAIEDAGFEIRDLIMWVNGSGFPKSHNVSKAIDQAAGTGVSSPEAKQWEGWGTALKPAQEPIVLARKPLIDTVANNVLAHGTGGLNIDGCRVSAGDENFDNLKGRPITKLSTRRNGETDEEHKSRLVTNPSQQVALAKLKELGRWPANFLHDGSDEVIDLLGDAARFFYCAKASKRDRNEGLDTLPTQAKVFNGQGGAAAGNAEGSADDTSKTQPEANFHPTVKPTELMRYLCRLITPPKGTVLDPFMGSGSTGKAAVLEGFNFIGIDMTPEYHPIATARIKWAQVEAKSIAKKVKQRELTTHKLNAASVVGMKQKKAPAKKQPAAGPTRATKSVHGL